MAGSNQFEFPAGSPEGSTFHSAIPNGQRAGYSSASLDRPGSFRERADNRILNSGPGSSRGTTPSSMEISPTHFLNLEQIVTADQKFTRSGELRRVFGGPLASTSEDHAFGASLKVSPPVAAEEIKRVKASVIDTCNKTRNRSKKLTESIGKLDKYRHVLLSRRRRTEPTERSGGSGVLKTGNQIHQSPSDNVTQRLEDRNKNVTLNKRVRTSLTESEGKSTAVLRQPVVVEKDRDMPRASIGSSLPVEEKIRGLPAAGEGWDKRMKRKRPVGAVATRSMEGERESKRAMHQKPINDPKPRSYDVTGFGLGPTNGIAGSNKSDVVQFHTNISNGRVLPRNEVDNVSFSNDRRERIAVDKERVLLKGSKLSAREDIQVGSPIPVTKGKVSRAPRSGSAAANSSPSINRTSGVLDGWEQPSGLKKDQSVGAINNRKPPVPTGSSSPPMAQWVGQRQQKSSRTRRANLVSPVSNHDEAQLSSDTFSAPDFGVRLTANEANGSVHPKGVSTNSSKMKFENALSPAILSESEESGAGENKLKEKSIENGDTEDRFVNTIQKVGSVVMPTKKNRMLGKEEIGDGVRRQGRSGRVSSIARAGVSHTREKLENPATGKPVKSMKAGSDRNESKSGRPPPKKAADRKAFSRPGNVLNSGSSDMTGESDDDREDLLAAASSVHGAPHLACSGPFWKQMEPIFAAISSEDTAYLKRQLMFAEELDETLSHMGELEQSEVVSSRSIVSREGQGIYLNGIGSKGPTESLDSVNHFQDSSLSGKLNGERRSTEVTPLYQRVLSALIGEDDIEMLDHSSGRTQSSFEYASGPVHVEDQQVDFEVDSDASFRTQSHCAFGNCSFEGSTVSNSFRNSSVCNPPHDDGLWPRDDIIAASEVEFATKFVKNQPQPVDVDNVSVHSLEFPYEEMSLDDKLLLELQSIGLYPEEVPDLAEGEEEEINKDIYVLKEGLYQQVGKKKAQLCKIDMVIQKGREVEERNLEQSAMNKLVETAYKKRMACRGNSAVKSGISRVSKQAALAFAKRTIARCRKFEETGKSCFSEPALRDTIFPSCYNDIKPVDVSGACTNPCVEAHNSQPESMASAVHAISASVVKHIPFGDRLNKGLSDTIQAATHSSDQDFAKQESLSNGGKKKDVLFDEVAGIASSRVLSVLGSTLNGGTKGKRSERDRDQNKSTSIRNPIAKAGRPALGGFRGERKTKTRPKQKTAQLSMSGNGLLSRPMEATNPVYSPLDGGNEKTNSSSSKLNRESGLLSPGNTSQDLAKETKNPSGFTNLQLHELDPIEQLDVSGNLVGNNDLAWLDFDEDGLQDHDSMGLEIPMDDLSELQMLI